MTRVYAFVEPPTPQGRAAMTERYGAHGEALAWWAPDAGERLPLTVWWLREMGLGSRDVSWLMLGSPAPSDLDENGRCLCGCMDALRWTFANGVTATFAPGDPPGDRLTGPSVFFDGLGAMADAART